MVEIKSASYEECRAEHFKKLMLKMQRKIDHWQHRGRYSLEHQSVLSRAYHECSEAGIQYNFYNDALAAFENQPKWISVEERLPEESGRYLVHTYDDHIIDAYYSEEAGKWWSYGVVVADKRFTHWMPLPSTEGLNDT